MADKKSLVDSVAEIEKTISAFQNKIRTARTDSTNVEFYERSRQEHLDKIAWHQKMLEQLEYRHHNADVIIADAQRQIQRLKKKLLLVKHHRDVARLLKLQSQINELQEVADVD